MNDNKILLNGSLSMIGVWLIFIVMVNIFDAHKQLIGAIAIVLIAIIGGYGIYTSEKSRNGKN